MGYNYKPLAGPQALYTPQKGFSYLTAQDIDGAERALIRKFGNTLSKPQTASGDPFEVTGPFTDSQTIYFFGKTSPVLRKSVSGGASSTDIAPSGVDFVRPVLPLVANADDDLLVVASGGGSLTMQQRYGGVWSVKGTVPISPECGARSAFLGTEVLLGQASAGQQYTVAFSGNRGEDWSDLSDGLPDVKITSITGHSGGEAFKPKLSRCELAEIVLGRYWYAKYQRYNFPWTWDYDTGDYCQYFIAYYKPQAEWGTMITHMYLTNCVEHESELGITFDLEVYLYSPIGLDNTTGLTRILYQYAADKEDLEQAPYYKKDLYHGPCASVTKLSGSWNGPGWFKIVFRPFDYWYADKDYLPYSSSWMAFSIVYRGTKLWSRRGVSIQKFEEECPDAWSCDDPGNSITSIMIGERSYPDFYLTLRDEFEARWPLYDLTTYRGYCVGQGSDPFYSYVYSTDYLGGAFTPWHDYEYWDLGAYFVHITEE